MRQEFSTLNIVRALDIPMERLREWMVRGFIKPSRPSEGQGKKAVFTRADVYMVALFRELLNKGLSRKVAAAYIKVMPRMVDDQVKYLLFSYGDYGYSNPHGVKTIASDIEMANYFTNKEYQGYPSIESSGFLILNYGGLQSKIDKDLDIIG